VSSFRTVRGTALTTFWTDAGPGDPVRAAEISLVGAYLARPWGLQYFGVWANPDGSFEVPGVPEGPVVLQIQGPNGMIDVETTSDEVDLGIDLLGRADLAYADQPTPVTFSIDGLDPTGSPTVAFAVPNAGLALAAPVPGPVEWASPGLALVEAAKGDVAWLLQTGAATDPAIPATVTTARRCLSEPLGGLAFTNGSPATVGASLAPCAATGTLSADWRISQFKALQPQVHPDAVIGGHRLAVLVRPHESPFAPGFRTGLLYGLNGLPLAMVAASASAEDVTVTGVEYGLLQPPSWSVYRHDRTRFTIPFLAPGASSRTNLGVNLGADAAVASVPYVVAPVVSPPRNLRIGGQDAWSPGLSWVGFGPTVSWDHPDLVPAGRTPLYDVLLFRLDPTATGGTTLVQVLEGKTASTSFQISRGLDCCGYRYVVAVTATITDATLDAPLRSSVELAYATVVSREFAPYYW
jgi:hypothetical protein